MKIKQFPELSDKGIQDALYLIERFKSKLQIVANEEIGNLYSGLVPHIETDAWSNYREELRIELEHEYKYSKFKEEWATNFRRAVFVENREEISKLIESDILKRIKHLEDCRQEFEAFRYTPLGDTYQDLKKQNEILIAKLADMTEREKILEDALNRIVGMVNQWTDEYGQRRTEEIYASKIAREAIEKSSKIKDTSEEITKYKNEKETPL